MAIRIRKNIKVDDEEKYVSLMERHEKVLEKSCESVIRQKHPNPNLVDLILKNLNIETCTTQSGINSLIVMKKHIAATILKQKEKSGLDSYLPLLYNAS